MASLLEVLVTFVGAMLVLALAAQSLQEIIKASVGIKGGARQTALERLVMQSALGAGLNKPDGDDINKYLIDRLRALGQKGIWKTNLRLDVVDADKLRDLILELHPKDVRGLDGGDAGKGKAMLADVAERAHKWFPLSLDPVADRHERRMKIGAILAGAAVVLAVNADAFWILDHARNDPAFRTAVATQVDSLGADARVVEAIDDTLQTDTTLTNTQFEALLSRRDSAATRRDARALAALTGEGALFPGYTGWQFSRRWLLGILISVLLVGLGAPFWHDLLASVMGMKERVRAKAKEAVKDAEKAAEKADNVA